MSYDVICFDCDSTLSRIEGIDELARWAGVGEDMAKLTDLAMNGELPLEAVYGKRLETIRPDKASVDRLADLYIQEMVEGVKTVFATLLEKGKEVHIISGGLRQAILPLAEVLNVPENHVHAVDIQFNADGSYKGYDESSPLARSGGKGEICTQLLNGKQALAMIGDGKTDMEAKQPGVTVIGFGGICDRAVVREMADEFTVEPNLLAILPFMNISQKELWQKETGIYLNRLDDAAKISEELIESYNIYWPGVFFSTPEPSDSASVALKIGVYASNLFSTSLLVSQEVPEQWKKGLFVLIPISIRFVIEIWGAIHYARKKLDYLIKEGKVEEVKERIEQLLFGARIDKNSKVRLPFIDAGFTDKQSINIMTFIDSLKDVSQESIENYNFLCEASHPNFVQSTYFQLAGPPLPNWGNGGYRTHAHELLEKTVNAFVVATSGMQTDLVHILKTATVHVNSEMS